MFRTLKHSFKPVYCLHFFPFFSFLSCCFFTDGAGPVNTHSSSLSSSSPAGWTTVPQRGDRYWCSYCRSASHTADHQTEQTRFSLSPHTLLPFALCLALSAQENLNWSYQANLLEAPEIYYEFECFPSKFRNQIQGWIYEVTQDTLQY